MKARIDKSPLALTEAMAAALRVIAKTPLLDASAIAREAGPSVVALDQLCRRGLAKAQSSARRDGSKATLYLATSKGFDALDRIAKSRPSVSIIAAAKSEAPYTCPELGRTCHRPGAYDAFALPSLFAEGRRAPRAAA